MKAVILAAGQSERLKPFTETRAKPMIRIAGKTILEYMMASLKEAGVTNILIVNNHKREGMESYFEHGDAFGLEIDYILQDPIDGIGAGLQRCEPALGDEPFLLVYGDILATGQPFSRVMEQHTESGGAVAALSLPSQSGEFGNVYVDNDMRITRLVEKPSDPHLSNYVFAGIYMLPGNIFESLKSQGNNMEKCFQELISQGNLFGAQWEGGWIDIRLPWQILEANRMVMDNWQQAEIHASVKLQGNVQIEGQVHIEKGVTIGAGTVLKGPCYIGANSFIGNNTLIREYTSLGPNSSVGYGTELKNCVLFGESTLGRLSFIGDSVIGEKVHLGTGVTTVNYLGEGEIIAMDSENGPLSTGMNKVGAFIGDNVYLGARHVLGPGSRIRSGFKAGDMVTQPSVI